MPIAVISFNAITSQASETLARFGKTIESSYPGLLSRYPVEDYVQALDSSDPLSGHCYAPPLVQKWCGEINDSGGSNALGIYHKMVLAHLITHFDDRVRDLRIPGPVLALLAASLQKILDQFEDAESSFYLFDNELFCKDIALCRLKLLPCGSELVDRCSGVPRSILFQGGLQQFARSTGFFLLKDNGFRPWYESHWDRRLIRYFTPEDYDQCYLHIAQLLELNPEISGMTGASWWFDPALESISPKLMFLRKVPMDNGAQLFRVGSNAAATRAATRLSAERKQLYDAGEYRPAVYLLAWARKDLLAWADRYSS